MESVQLPAGVILPSRTLFGFPRGAALIVAVEFWERYSFFCVLSILALFVTAAPAQGGLGWSEGRAYSLVGLYTGLMYALPMLGAVFADRFWGYRRAITAGCLVMLAGHLVLASPASVGLGFYIGLACLIGGNGLMKAAFTVLLGSLFDDRDPRRDAAYAYYYLSINLGGVAAGVATGWIGGRYGWHAGFIVSSTGMAIALLLYLLLGDSWLGSAGRQVQRSTAKRAEPRSPAGMARRLSFLLVLALLLCTYELGSYQLFATWTLFIQNSVDRNIGSFVVPTTWITSLNFAVIIPATPLLAMLYVWLGRRRCNFDIVRRYALCLLLGATALAIFGACAALSSLGGKPVWIYPAVGIVLMATGEMIAWTSTLGAIYQLAPRQLLASVFGAFVALTMGGSGVASSWVAQFAAPLGLTRYFFGLAGMSAAGAVVALLIRPSLQRLLVRAGATMPSGISQ